MLDLDARVDLDEVMTALLVDEEFCGTGVAVVYGFGEFQRIVEDGLTDRLVKMGSGGDFDDLRSQSLLT